MRNRGVTPLLMPAHDMLHQLAPQVYAWMQTTKQPALYDGTLSSVCTLAKRSMEGAPRRWACTIVSVEAACLAWSCVACEVFLSTQVKARPEWQSRACFP